MEQSEITLQSSGPGGETRLVQEVRAGKGFLSVRWQEFMLTRPVPADIEADVQAAKAALEESADRIPYDQVRRHLGLE